MRFKRRDFPGVPASDLEELCAQLHPGYWMVEAGRQPPPGHRPGLLLRGLVAQGGLAISLRSVSLLEMNLGHALVCRLQAEGCGLAPLAGLALHELLVNAAIHGNLAVGSGASAQWGDLAVRQASIERALVDPIKAGRIVTAAIGWNRNRVWASIADEGAGYAPQPDLQAPAEAPRGSGRGLSIARSVGRVDVAADGRCTRLALRRLHPGGAG